MDETKSGIQYLFQTQAKWTLAVSGTGHCAMEAALINLAEPGQKVLVCSNGVWGQRFADLADRFGINAVPLKKPPGHPFTTTEIDQALSMHMPQVLFITHGESSSGTLQNLEGLGSLCHKYNTLLLVDSVAAAGGVPLLMDQWEIDCVYTGSQKCLGAPPGICPIAFSVRAQNRIEARKRRVPSFYLDMMELTNYWGCDDGPRRYHHTGPISMVYALRESLRLLAEEGLEASWTRHAAVARQLHRGIESDLGLQLLVPEEAHRLPCVTAVCVPQGVDWKAVTGYMMSKHAIEIAGGLGPTAGQIWRIGLMGVNATESSVDKVLTGLKEALQLNSLI